MAIQNHFDPLWESRELEAIRKVEESIAYMMGHLDMPLQASTLAARVNVSPSHFFSIFKRHVGNTPIDYFIRLRMRRARRLLEQTGMSIKAIAYTLGYDDPYYFSRVFKSFNRITPSKYRRLKLNPGRNKKPSNASAFLYALHAEGRNMSPVKRAWLIRPSTGAT